MKKLIAILLCMVCVLSLTIPVFAEEIAETKQTIVSLEVDPSMESYTLTIPATISISPTEKNATLDVTLEDVALVWHNNLNVYAVTANHDTENGGSFLVNTEDPTKKIHYILEDFNESIYGSGESERLMPAWTSWSGGSEKELRVYSGWIKLTVDGEYPGAGTYTDTITFTVELS